MRLGWVFIIAVFCLFLSLSPFAGGVLEGGQNENMTIKAPSNTANATAESVMVIEPNRTEISVKYIELVIKPEVEKYIAVIITSIPEPPEDVEDITGIVYQYIEIEYGNLTEEEVVDVTAIFKVPKTWVAGMGIDKSDVYLARYRNKWERLPANLTGETSDMYHYTIKTLGPYLFAVFTEKYVEHPGKDNVTLIPGPVNLNESILKENVSIVPEPIVLNESELRERLEAGGNVTIETNANITGAVRKSWNPEGLEESVNFTAGITNITRESPAAVGINKTEISVKNIEVRVREDVGRDISITVTRIPEEPPEDIPDITGIVYQYIEIEHGNLGNEEIENASIVFEVKKTWVTGNSINKSDIHLARYTDKWDRLPTEFLNETGNVYYYRAAAPGLSMFAIFTEKIVVSMDVECVPLDVKCEGNTVYECSLEGIWQPKKICSYVCRDGECMQEDEPAPEPGGKTVLNPWEAYNLVMIFVAVIIVVALLGAYLRFRHKRVMAELPGGSL